MEATSREWPEGHYFVGDWITEGLSHRAVTHTNLVRVWKAICGEALSKNDMVDYHKVYLIFIESSQMHSEWQMRPKPWGLDFSNYIDLNCVDNTYAKHHAVTWGIISQYSMCVFHREKHADEKSNDLTTDNNTTLSIKYLYDVEVILKGFHLHTSTMSYKNFGRKLTGFSKRTT